MKALGVGLLVLGGVAAAPRLARAQHCHIDVPEDAAGHQDPTDPAHAHHHGHHGAAVRTWWLGASSTAIAGSGTMLGETRDYQGLAVAVHGGWKRVSARLAVPAYRVADEGVGMGDVVVGAAADVMPGRGRLRAGLGASWSAPTGDSASGRGMGHSMVALGAWTRVPAGFVRIDGTASWARAVGDGAEHAAHAHAASMWPLVDPMNPEEILVDARATAALGARVRAGAGGTYARPLVDGGAVRGVTYAVAELTSGRYTFASQLAVPVAGDPFVARGTFELSYRH
jgi:hypothetical protein